MGKYFSILLVLLVVSGCAVKMVERQQARGADGRELAVDWGKTNILLEEVCRAKYKDVEFDFGGIVVVAGQLANGRTYPIWIDSGMVSWPVLVNDTVMRENGLSGSYGGAYILPSLSISDLTIENVPFLYVPRHWEFQVLGVPVWQDRRVVYR